MVRASIEGNDLLIELSPIDAFLAFHGSLRIPLAHVLDVSVENENGWKAVWKKIVGTNFPGVKIAGTFFGEGGIVFNDYGDGTDCLVVRTQHETYRAIVVQLPEQDARAMASQIRTRLSSNS